MTHEENDEEGNVNHLHKDNKGVHTTFCVLRKQAKMTYFDTHPNQQPVPTSNEACVRHEATVSKTSIPLTPLDLRRRELDLPSDPRFTAF
jgi:hypothetical protein